MQSVNLRKTGCHGNVKIDIYNTEKEIVSPDKILGKVTKH